MPISDSPRSPPTAPQTEGRDTLVTRTGWDDAFRLGARACMAAIFWQSGRTKVDGLTLNDSALYLFQEEYRVPVLDPIVAAHIAAISEHVFPLLLVLGLATRLSAFALLSMTAVIQVFVYPDAWATHGTWALLLGWLTLHGAGRWSLDHLFAVRPRQRRRAGDLRADSCV